MPLFALIGRDGPRSLELRRQHRDAHLEGLRPLDRTGRIRHGGPLLDEKGQPVGSLMVFEAPDLASARRQVERDPYVVQGIFASWELFETGDVFPER
jgi:hypothetical protein